MSEKKRLVVNCDICDCRKLKRESYEQYEEIVLNTDLVLVSSARPDVLTSLPVTGNFDHILEVEDGVNLIPRAINGSYTLTGGMEEEGRLFLTVNGRLDIKPDAEEALKRCLQIVVNGVVSCPQSLSAYLGRMTVNGASMIYPDDCIVQKANFAPDRYFPLRAKEGGRYYACHRVVLTDLQTDVALLREKQVRFVTPEALVAEELLPDAAMLFAEETQMKVVPAGYAVVPGGQAWSRTMLEKYGKKLYVNGNLLVGTGGTDGLEEVEHLIVSGKLETIERWESFVAGLNADWGELVRVKGRVLENKAGVTVDEGLLDGCADGLLVRQCARVNVHEGTPREAILKRLEIQNCGKVICGEDNRSAVEQVCGSVGSVMTAAEEAERAKEREIGPKSACVINADYYRM